MRLVELKPNEELIINLTYATENNISGKKVYKNHRCFIHEDAVPALNQVIELIKPFGMKLKVFDAYRPKAAQIKLWECCPDPRYVADPEVGSVHNRGVAIDITLVDSNGQDVDMGTPFDDFTEQSHHGNTEVSIKAQQNRWFLAGIMSYCGWEINPYEWWHYQINTYENYPLILQNEVDELIM